jgi:hypothetical protein
MTGDRCYTTRSGLRIGSAYTQPQRCDGHAVYATQTNPTMADIVVLWACVIAICALILILLAEAI